MNAYNLILVVPIFIILYSAVGLLLGSRKKSVPFGQSRYGSPFHWVKNLTGAAGGSLINKLILKTGGYRQKLDLLLMRSGYPFGWNAGDYLVVKEVVILLAAVGVWQLDPTEPAAWALGIAGAFLLPDIWLRIRANERKAVMQRALPGMIDLLALAVESGLDLLVAIERITDKMARGPQRDELQILMQEARLGSPRRDILQRWAHRTGLTDAQSLSSLIIQSDEMGTPLANVLRNYAEDMRSRRILRAEEIAGKIPVKILFPMMVFFFPIVFVIILGPVALDFFKNSR